MFTLHTAKAGDAYHTLTPHVRLVEIDPPLGHSLELLVKVRVDHGHPDCPYTFKFVLEDAFGRPAFDCELISRTELVKRMAHATENGADYDLANVHAAHDDSKALIYANQIKKHFLSMMALDLFALQPNI